MEAVFLSFVNRSIAAGYLILAVILLRLLLKKAPKALRCVLWLLVAVRLVCPISLKSSLSLIPSAQPLPSDILYTAAPAINSGISSLDSVVNPILSTSLAPDPVASANPTQIWSFLLAWVWVIGVAVLLLYALFSYARLRRMVRASLPLERNVLLCDRVESPFILGVFRPKIYLPSGLEYEQLTHIIAHENAHLARKDQWWKPLGYLLLCLYWFNPLLWAAYILLCRDIELACDERVIRTMAPEEKKAYSSTLLSCSISRRQLSACPLAFGEVGVKQRIRSVLSYKKPAFWVVLAGIAACIVAAVCFLTNPIPEEAPPMPEATMTAQVLQINDKSLLVAPTDTPDRQIWVTMMNLEPSPEPQVEDIVEITYDGLIAETFPEQLNNPYHIRVIPRLTMDNVISLMDRKGGDNLSWQDFEAFYHTNVGSETNLHDFPINENYHLQITTANPDDSNAQILLFGPIGSLNLRQKSTRELNEFLVKEISLHMDTAQWIPQLFDLIESAPLESDNPDDYLKLHPEEVQELMGYGTETLRFVITQFLEGNQVGLYGHHYWYFLNELAPEEQLKCTAENGQEYFDQWFAHAQQIASQNTREFMESYMPASTLALDLAGLYPAE